MPTTRPPALTMTAPTQGLGEARAMPCLARSRACRRNWLCVSRELVTQEYYFTTESQRHGEPQILTSAAAKIADVFVRFGHRGSPAAAFRPTKHRNQPVSV